MANKFYQPWADTGRHFTLATPIKELLAQLKAAFPAAASAGAFGTIGNEAHLTASTPEDHTPYSQTGYPVPTPYGIVTALDIDDDPARGVHGQQIFEHLLDAARSGAAPWVKYINWAGKQYDRRRYWVPRDSSDVGHIHLSIMSNMINDSVGSFSITGGSGDMELVKAIQQSLTDAGFDPGPVDGQWGPRTQAAFTAALRRAGGVPGPAGPQGPKGDPGEPGRTPTKVALHLEGTITDWS